MSRVRFTYKRQKQQHCGTTQQYINTYISALGTSKGRLSFRWSVSNEIIISRASTLKGMKEAHPVTHLVCSRVACWIKKRACESHEIIERKKTQQDHNL
jgi:hypothetical protein